MGKCMWGNVYGGMNAPPPKLAFKWFDSGMSDLEHETQLCMFNSYILKVDPSKLDNAGYHCLRNFFETINLVERKLKKISTSYQSLVRSEGCGLWWVWSCHCICCSWWKAKNSQDWTTCGR